MTRDVSDKVSFGYRDVAAEEKSPLVREIFSSVARRYDMMNDLMSGGVHRLWKDAMVEWLNPRPGWTVIDAAGGTGDVAFRIAARIATGGQGAVHACDINSDMLREGIRRAAAEGHAGVTWVCGDAEALPFPDGIADAYTIAFGIRNVTRIERALGEAYRALKYGGRFLCLEFSRVAVPGFDALYDRYSFGVLPRLGGWVTGDADAYRYLAESIRRFPDQKRFAKMIADAGFERVAVRNLSGGVAALHSAWRL